MYTNISVIGELCGFPFSFASGVGFWDAVRIRISGDPKGGWDVVESFVYMELHPWVSEAPFPLNQSWKRAAGDPAELKSKAGVQSFRSSVELSRAQH